METETPVVETPLAPVQPLSSRAAAILHQLSRPAVLIATLALMLLGWQWLETQSKLSDLQQEVAKRLAESSALIKQNHEALQVVQHNLGAFDARLAEAQSQQKALEAMYQELSSSRDERVLAEIEQTVMMAAQQLQLAGNVEAALIALRSAEVRLAHAVQGRPSPFLELQKLIKSDISRLEVLPPLADVPNVANQVERVVTVADELPLAFERRVRLETPAAGQPADKAPGNTASDGQGNTGFWQALGRDVWLELKQLIRVERTDRSDPGLLSPTHAFFLRENLKLRLLDARLALLQRDGGRFREDVRHARVWIERYFDTSDKAVQSVLAALQNISSVELSFKLPALDKTMSEIGNVKQRVGKIPSTPGPRQKGAR